MEDLELEQLERVSTEVAVPIDGAELEGTLALPDDALGLVVFAHGSGSGRFSPRNRYVADALARAGLGSLLLDLLTQTEQRHDSETRDLRFDIDRLSIRLVRAIDWLDAERGLGEAAIGAYGASTGAAAALVAAAERPERVAAVVSRGGRVDLAKGYLERVGAPTLMIVGEHDQLVLDLNTDAAERMQLPAMIEVVPGAGHLFEEEGALESVAELTVQWFSDQLGGG